MRYVSTRGESEPVDFVGALLGGLAPDGGLYVPESIPGLPDGWRRWDYRGAVSGSLEMFGAEDTRSLVEESASRFEAPEVAPIVEVGGRLVLELFWGPTLSFKDHALGVVARLLARETSDQVVLGATSGDTGSAAIEACRGSLPIVFLYPDGAVSDLQRRQMTTVADEGVKVLAVRGSFDDCQALVKEAFGAVPNLLAVNSINFSRVAAQVGYYIHAAATIGEPFDVVVPTGNFGNVYSCWMAQQMGAPIESIVIANNANRFLADLVNLEVAEAGPVTATVAPAMDIQVPSNLERLPVNPSETFLAGWVSDGEIRETIAAVDADHGYLLDPHTATAWAVGAEYRSEFPQLIVATAHPAKFPEVVEQAVGRLPEVPDQLARLHDLPESFEVIDPTLDDLVALL